MVPITVRGFLILCQVPHVAPPTAAILGLLSEICDSVSMDVTPARVSNDQREFLKILDWRIGNIHTTDSTDEMLQLAALIYLSRISGSLLNQPLKIEQRIHRAFSTLSHLRLCERQFPIFIVGCEARTDDQRAIILDLISRTEGNTASRSFGHTKLLLEAIWAQDDLIEGQHEGLRYCDKLSSTMSRCKVPPSFA